MGFDVGLHGIEAQRIQARVGGGEEGGDGFVFDERAEIIGDVSNEQAFGEGLVAIEVSDGIIFTAYPGAGFSGRAIGY